MKKLTRTIVMICACFAFNFAFAADNNNAIAIAHAVSSTTIAINNLDGTTYCQLKTILNDQNKTNLEKYTAISENPQLNDYKIALDNEAQVVANNDLSGVVNNEELNNLLVSTIMLDLGIDIDANRETIDCSGYNKLIRQIGKDWALCCVSALDYCLGCAGCVYQCYGVVSSFCHIKALEDIYKADQQSPECAEQNAKEHGHKITIKDRQSDGGNCN